MFNFNVSFEVRTLRGIFAPRHADEIFAPSLYDSTNVVRRLVPLVEDKHLDVVTVISCRDLCRML